MKASLDEMNLWSDELERLDAVERVAWAWERFGSGLVLSTSFGLQSAVMIHLVRQVSEEIPIVFVDTGYLFPGTYEYALTLQEKLGFKAKVYSASVSPAFQEAKYGKLWEQGRDGMAKYNLINKKEPMDRALRELGATCWMAGLRRDQSGSRSELPVMENRDEIFKLYPILNWDNRKTYRYLPDNGLPYHPLEGVGYVSLGDWHSTKKLSEVDDPEETRHGGHGRECGLHLAGPDVIDFNI